MVACDDDDDTGTTPPPVAATGTISGAVTVEGAGLAGVTVSMVGATSASASTGADGSYSFTNVPAGTYGVQIAGVSLDVTFSTTSQVVTVTGGQTSTASFSGNSIRTASIRGSITAGSTGIVATVSLAGTGMLSGVSASGTSDTNGDFEFTGLRAGDYTVTVSDFGSAEIPVTSRDVTVATGQSASVTFVGTVEEVTTAATVTISSITVSGTAGATVIPGAVVGSIDVNLTISEGTATLVSASVLLDGEVVGTQTFSTGAPAEEGPDAAERTATIQINSAACGVAPGTICGIGNGDPTHSSGAHVVTAEVVTSDGATASASQSTNLTFANADLLIGTLSMVDTAVSATSQLWGGGDATVGVTPVAYSGKTVGSITVTLVQTPGAPVTTTAVTEDTAPFTCVFSSDTGDELDGWQTDAADPDALNITAAAYTDGSGFALGNGGDPNAFAKINNSSPALALFDNILPSLETAGDGGFFALPDAVETVDEVEDINLCCDNNWVTSGFEFDNALGDIEDDDVDGPGAGEPGVGGIVVTFHAGDADDDWDEDTAMEDFPHGDTPGDAGLEQSLLSTDFQLWVGLTDALGNVSYTALKASAGTNAADFFGIDDTPADFDLAGVADMTIYNGVSGTSGDGIEFTSVIEDVPGFGDAPVSGWMTVEPEVGDGPFVIAEDEEDGGPVNLPLLTDACGATEPLALNITGDNSAFCIPDGTAGPEDGLYTFGGTLFSASGATTDEEIIRLYQDLTDPEITANVSPSPVLEGGDNATFSGGVSDNLDLASAAFTFDFDNDAVWIPFSDPAAIGDDDPFVGAWIDAANPAVTLPFVTGLEKVTADDPDGTMDIITNVRIIATDAAGNISAAASNNIIANTVNGGTPPVSYGAGGIDAEIGDGVGGAGWLMVSPAANTEICNGVGDPDETTEVCEDVTIDANESLDLELEVSGPSGTFSNPFLSGTIFFYLKHPVSTENVLLGSVLANSAALTDDGDDRTYAWDLTLQASDVDGFAVAADAFVVFAIGVNADGLGLRLADVSLDVVDGAIP